MKEPHLLMAGLLALSRTLPATSPVWPSGLAGEVIQVRLKDNALVRQDSWEYRRDVLSDGGGKDLCIEQANS